MENDRNGLEPSLSEAQPISGLEPAIRPLHIDLDGLRLTRLAEVELLESPVAILPTPQAGSVVLVLGHRPYRYETLHTFSSERVPLGLPPELALLALDASGRYYMLESDGKRLVRLTQDFQEDLHIDLRGERDLSIGQDGNLYTWLFSSGETEVYDPAGQLLRVLEHNRSPYSLAVDERGGIWLGWAAMSHVVEISPLTGETLGYIDPKEDFSAENLFCYTYDMNFDRSGNLWTFNGQGDVGMTIINPDKAKYLRFACQELGPEYQDSLPVPSPWNDELYIVSKTGRLSVFRPSLLDWKPITPDIHSRA
jgi:hypothetical protein